MSTETCQLTLAEVPSESAPDTEDLASKRRFVTVIYEIVDGAAWKNGQNPLNYEHNGLKSICVSAGDLAALTENIEAVVQDGERLTAKQYEDLYRKHVMDSFSP